MKQTSYILKTKTLEAESKEECFRKGAQPENKEKQQNKDRIIVEKLLQSRDLVLGKIIKIEEASKQILVVCPSVSDEETEAKLGSPYLTYQDLLIAMDQINLVVLDFQTFDGQPVIRDILYSLNEKAKSCKAELKNKKVHIVADEIILEGKQKVTIKSGESETIYEARNGKLTEKARKITSAATLENKVQGGAVRIN